jgi:lysophospholipase L1-like esterase
MLTKGKVIAQIRIWFEGKVVATKPFEIEVGGIAGVMSGVVQQQEFSFLTAVLADANSWRTDIDRKINRGENEAITKAMIALDLWEEISNNEIDINVNTSMIEDGAVNIKKLSNDVNMIKYPFVTSADVPNAVKQSIIDIKMFNVDARKKYALTVVRKSQGTDKVYSLIVYEATGDNVLGDAIASFNELNYVPSESVERVYLTSTTSTALIEILIDWSVLPNETNLVDMRYNKTGIHQSCIQKPINKDFRAYPFVYDPRYRKSIKNDAILDVQLIGADPNKSYTIGSLYKNYQGTTRIIIHEWDKKNNQWAGGSSVTSGRSSWTVQDYVPTAPIEWVEIPRFDPSSGGFSGFTTRMLIDWTKIENGARLNYNSFNSLSNNFDLFHPNTVISQQNLMAKTKNILQPQALEGVNYEGRWFKRELNGQQVVTTNMYGQKAYLGFYGNSLSVDVLHDVYNAGIGWRIDGGEWHEQIISESGTIILATELENKDHFVEIYSRVAFGYTEDESPFFSGKGNLNIAGFDKSTYHLKADAPTLLFLGDSITAGQGSSFGDGYAGKTATLLNSNVIRVAQPGGALVSNDSRPYLPNLQQLAFNNADGQHAIPEKADAIVINIGHNDSASVTDSQFRQALVSLVNKLKTRYPSAPIILMRPFSGKRSTAIRTAVNETGVFYLDTTGWEFTTVDGTHPDGAGAEAIAKRLAPELSKILYSK